MMVRFNYFRRLSSNSEKTLAKLRFNWENINSVLIGGTFRQIKIWPAYQKTNYQPTNDILRVSVKYRKCIYQNISQHLIQKNQKISKVFVLKIHQKIEADFSQIF
jgi:hypothetical protein